jgi:tetratricopeptide (TPR) repeat protein
MLTCKSRNSIHRVPYFIVFFSFFVLSCSFESSKITPSDHSDHIVGNEEQIEIPQESEVRYLFIRGELALKQDDYKKALSFLEEARKKTKKPSPTIEKRLAQLYIRDGKLNEALKAAERIETAGGNLNESLKLRAGIQSALGNTDQAIQIYQQLVKNSSAEEEEPFLLLSGIYIQNSKFSDAVKVLEDLTQKNPNSFIATYYLAKLHASLRDFGKSAVFYKKALELNPSAEQVALEYIKVLVLNKQGNEAIKECQKLVNQNPDNLKAREFLAELLLGEKKIELAINEFEEAKKVGNNPIDIQFKVALLKLQQRDFKGAEAELNLILNKQPDNNEARYFLATAYASQDKIDTAIEQLKKISPKSDLYKKGLGFSSFLLRQEKRYDEALDVIEEALKRLPDDIELLGYKNSIERESGELDDAIETLKKISSLDPNNEQHLFNLAIALDESGEREEAISLVEKVIQKNPNNANALNYLGYSLAEQAKELPRAEELIKRALEIEKDNGFFMDSLGWVYYQAGNYDKALPVLEKSVTLTQGDPVILEHLGRVYIKLNRRDEAREVLEQALENLEKSPQSAVPENFKSEVEDLLKSLE